MCVCVCVCDPTISSSQGDSCEELTDYCRDLLHGKGYDRWFDKSLTMVFYANGKVWMSFLCASHVYLLSVFSTDLAWYNSRTLMGRCPHHWLCTGVLLQS